MSRMNGGGCLDRLSEYHFKEAHDFYWQRSSQRHCQHCLRHCFSKDPVDISFQVLYNRNMPSYSAGLGGNYAALPPPPILKLFLTGSARISGLTQKADTKTEIRLKTENYHPWNRISNAISGSRYPRRSDFDDVNICSKFWMARKTTSGYLLVT